MFRPTMWMSFRLTGPPEAEPKAAAVARLVDDHPGWATTVAVVVFAACGVYQLTPLKSRCLKHCRSPLSLLLHYGAYRGRCGTCAQAPITGRTALAAAGR